jgi:membrane fusion protein (multidrug efflux system)
MKHSPLLLVALAFCVLPLSACSKSEGHTVEEGHEGGHESEERQIVVTTPAIKDVVTTEQYVCQIHSCRHIEVRALESGYLEAIQIKEGQAVEQGDLLFKIVPTLYQAKLDSEAAEAQLAQIELENTQRLFATHVVSDREVALAKAKLAKAQAQVKLAQAELNFTDVKAPFDGIVDRLLEQQGSLIEEGDELTSLSDNSVMWVYFNVPEARYLEYKSGMDDPQNPGQDMQIELVLANAAKFDQPGKIGAIEADFNNETGNIAFRADFPNPHRLLRHGQTGNILIHNLVQNASVIPQRATFDILDKRYVFVVGDDNVVHQREINVLHELEDIFVIGDDVQAGEKIVLEGVRQVRDGETIEFEVREPDEVLSDMKYEAE